MNQRISWEDRVKGAYASLRPSEQKVAEALLANRKTAAGLTIGELARRAGAFTIGGCGEKDSPVARQADLCLWTGAVGGTIYGSAIFSRVADLAVVDLLYMEIILSDYRTFSRSLDKSGAVIAGREYKET